MVKKDDPVILNKPELSIFDEEVTVYEPMIADEYAYYCGADAIVVMRKNGQTLVATKDEYELPYYLTKDNDNVAFDNVEEEPMKKFDVITLKNKDRGTKRLFYQTVDVTKLGVSFIDDLGNRRTYGHHEVEDVNLNNWFDYFNDLQQQVFDLREFVSESLELVVDDLHTQLKKFRQ